MSKEVDNHIKEVAREGAIAVATGIGSVTMFFNEGLTTNFVKYLTEAEVGPTDSKHLFFNVFGGIAFAGLSAISTHGAISEGLKAITKSKQG